jgi:hypothetical protein
MTRKQLKNTLKRLNNLDIHCSLYKKNISTKLKNCEIKTYTCKNCLYMREK